MCVTHSVARRAIDGVDMQQLVKVTIRLRSMRILVGEVRGAEALALIRQLEFRTSGRRRDRARQQRLASTDSDVAKYKCPDFGKEFRRNTRNKKG